MKKNLFFLLLTAFIQCYSLSLCAQDSLIIAPITEDTLNDIDTVSEILIKPKSVDTTDSFTPPSNENNHSDTVNHAETDTLNNRKAGSVEGSTSDSISNQIHGTVYDIDGVSPVIGATVSWVNNKSITQTDIDGKFMLPYFENDQLMVMSLGYTSKKINIQKGINDLRITLAPSQKNKLDEVVITAMGIMREKKRLSYDVQTIEGSKISEVRDGTGNVLSGLNGKVSGLEVTPAAGGAGSAVKIMLRGPRSITGSNNPLVVLDGVPISAGPAGSQPTDENGGYAGSDGAMNINADDIESINVLKGGAAAALYGGAGQNGALIITTKKGFKGPLSINYNGGINYQSPNLLMRYQNKYGRGNGGITAPTSGFSWGAPAATYADNVASFFQNAATINNSINFSGGSSSVQAYASYTNNYVQGIVHGNELNRNTLNTRVTGKIADKLTADVKVTYMDQKIKNKPKTGEIGTFLNAYIMPRDMSKDERRNFESFDDYGQPVPTPWPTSNPSIYMNPEWFTHRTSVNEFRKRATILGSLKYDFAEWLNIQARYSMDQLTDRSNNSYYDKTVVLAPQAGGQYIESYAQSASQYADLLLSGNKDFLKDFSVNYNLGASISVGNSNGASSTANGLTIPNKFYLQYGSSPATSSSIGRSNTQALFATAQLGFKNYLFLDGTFRTEWQAYLPAPYNFSYPSVGLTAILSDAFKLPSWISFAKVRGAYTVVGNGGSAYITDQYYTYAPGGGKGFISRDGTKPIPDLKPELSPGLEFGTDWSFFNDRISLALSVYKTNSINQLFSIQLPPTSGYSNQWINAGNVENKGIEFAIYAMPLKINDFSWTTNINFSKNTNKIIELSPEIKETKLSGSERLATIGIREGGSYGDIYGQTWAKNESGQHLVDDKGLPIIEQDQKVGSVLPDFMAGWSNTFKYKNISLSVLIDGRVGGMVVSGTDAYLGYYGLASYTEAFRDGGLILDAVHKDGSGNTTAIDAETFWTTVSQSGRAAYTEFFTYDATNFRVREIALGYTFNLKNKLLHAARVSLVGSNLFFLYRGNAILDIKGMPDRKIPIDPEVGLGAGNSQGLESGTPPISRSIGLNFKLFF